MTEDIATLFVTDDSGNVITDVNGEATLNPDYLAAMQAVKDAGLEIIMRNQTETPDYFNRLRGEDILTLQELVSGFYMCDEPSIREYGKHMTITELETIVEWFNTNGGDAFFHVNLLQSYGVAITEAGTNYIDFASYVDYYINNVLKNVNGRVSLSTDYYPLAQTTNGVNYIKEGYLSDLFLIANLSKTLKDEGYDVFSSYCIQLFKDSSANGLALREIFNVGDIRLQMNVALALGATSFEYYPYCDISGDGSGILYDQGNVLYHENTRTFVSTVNAETATLIDALSDFSWNGAKFVSKGTNTVSDITSSQLESFEWLDSFSSTKDAIVSEFSGENGVFAYMAVNYVEPTASDVNNDVTFDFGCATQALVIINGEQEIVDLTDNSYSVTLGAGESVFIYALHK